MGQNFDSHDRSAFLITIDTEGDNLWSRPKEITTRNAEFLPRFQQLCEKYSQRPTYLTNWEMAASPVCIEFGKDILARRVGEIGMHLHAWNSPPVVPLTQDDFHHQPFLIDYPEAQIRAKVQRMTECLESTFGVKIRSHRSGRWSFNETYARILKEHEYWVDCSVTPHHSWKRQKGNPAGPGGTDFSSFPEEPYFLDLDDISRPGDTSLLEIPMTIVPRSYPTAIGGLRSMIQKFPLGQRVAKRLFPESAWLRPNGRNLSSLLTILEEAKKQGRDYVELMLHSSELMPGGSPTFRTEKSIENLFDDLEVLFAGVKERFLGMTLTEYYARFLRKKRGIQAT